MQITINGRTYNLSFGLGFVREMNKLHSPEIEGLSVGYGGMALFNAGRFLNDPTAFVDVIKAATATEPQKPSDADLEAYIADLGRTGQYEATFNQIMEEVESSTILKMAMGLDARQAQAQPAPQNVAPLNPADTNTL